MAIRLLPEEAWLIVKAFKISIAYLCLLFLSFIKPILYLGSHVAQNIENYGLLQNIIILQKLKKKLLTGVFLVFEIRYQIFDFVKT